MKQFVFLRNWVLLLKISDRILHYLRQVNGISFKGGTDNLLAQTLFFIFINDFETFSIRGSFFNFRQVFHLISRFRVVFGIMYASLTPRSASYVPWYVELDNLDSSWIAQLMIVFSRLDFTSVFFLIVFRGEIWINSALIDWAISYLDNFALLPWNFLCWRLRLNLSRYFWSLMIWLRGQRFSVSQISIRNWA